MNDIKLSFDLYKNENNKISKLKSRTILFNFIMYKSNSSDINDFIDSKISNEKEFYSFDDVLFLINEKYEESKEADADGLYDYIVNKKNDDSKINKKQIIEAFENSKINLDENEIDKMIEFIKKKNKNNLKENNYITREEFKEFFVEQK